MSSAEQVRLHIASLQGNGWSLRAIAGHTGASPTIIHRYARGSVERPHAVVAAAVLRIDPSDLPSKTWDDGRPMVPRVGVVRRIQALQTLGWTHDELSRRCGTLTRTLVSQPGQWVTRDTHEKVAALYRELCTRPGPSPHTRGWALKYGYRGPLDWDDIDRDSEPDLGGAAA